MFQFFEGILAFIETIVAFVVNGIQLLVSTVLNIARALSWLILCIGYLPGWLTAFIVVPIALAVIFQILNKGS